MMEKNTTIYMEKELQVFGKENWLYNNIRNYTIKDLNTELFDKIQIEVDRLIKIKKEKEDLVHEERFQLRLKEQLEFKQKIIEDKEVKELTKNYEISFPTLEKDRSWDNHKIFYLNKPGKHYKFSTCSYKGSSYNNNKVWEIHFDYKYTGYTKLVNGLKKLNEKVNKEIIEKIREEVDKKIALEKTSILKNYAESNGYEFEEKYNYYKNRSGHSTGGYSTTFYMKKNGISAQIALKDLKPYIVNFSYKKSVSLETLKSLNLEV